MRPHTPLIAAMAMLAALPGPVLAADVLTGTFALPEGKPKVTAGLVATPLPHGRLLLDIAVTAIGQAHPLTRYDTELSKQMHVIAIGSDLGSFVHAHGDHPGPNGHFRVAMTLPHAGAYHIYADGSPAGLGQQVMRFEVTVGTAPTVAPPAAPVPSGLDSADGRYGVRFDPFTLRAGQESQLTLHITRDGQPARDVTPFLGVAAHAVFIDTANLDYVHVHAAPASTPAEGGPDHGMAAMGPALPAGMPVPPVLALHVLAPKAGSYRLWLQFMAGGRVRTVPFAVDVT